MGFTKYHEDNMEIREERLILRQQRNSSLPVRRVAQEACQHVGLATTELVEIAPKQTKKQKKKKKTIVCCDCGETFIFSGGEQKYYEARKLSEPKRCPTCRQKRKALFKTQKKNKEV